MDEAFLNDLLECSVCLEQLDISSKVLPCQHTFCKECLQEIITSHKELRCPECRTLVDCSIDELPSNILLIRLLEGIGQSNRYKKTQSKGVLDEKRSGKKAVLTCTSIASVVTNVQVHQLPTAQTTVAKRDHTKLVSKQIDSVLPCAKALYNYEAKEPGDLSFKKGDVIFLKKRLDQNWFQGELSGQSGIFPANYVQVVTPVTHAIPQCRALYDFAVGCSEQQDCLTFSKGNIIGVIRRIDENWAEGKMGSQVGIFPVSFVQMNAAAKAMLKLSASTVSGSSRIAPPTPTPENVQSSEENSTSGIESSGVCSSSEPTSGVPSILPSVSSSSGSPAVITTTAVPVNTPVTTLSHSVPISHSRSVCSQHKRHKDKRHSMFVLSSAGRHNERPANHRHSVEIVSSRISTMECQNIPVPSLSGSSANVTTAVTQSGSTLALNSGSKGHCRGLLQGGVSVSTVVTSAPVASPSQRATSSTQYETSANLIYIALYDYKPLKDEQLLLKKGDLYTVSERCSNGWFKGTCLQTRKRGIFPGNYVQLSKPSAEALQSCRTPTHSVLSGKVSPTATGMSLHVDAPTVVPNSLSSVCATNSKMPAFTKTMKNGDGSPWSRSRQNSPQPDPSSVSSYQPKTTSSSSDGSNSRMDFLSSHAQGSTSSVTMMNPCSVISVPSMSVSEASESCGGHNSSIGHSGLRSCPHFSSAHTVSIDRQSQSSPVVKNEKKKNKERIGLIRRLTSKCLSRSPPPVYNYSCDNAGFVDASSSCSKEQSKCFQRSSSCPNESLEGQNVNQKKSISLDRGTDEMDLHSASHTQALVRERFRCIVPYPPNSELELELEVGDVVYVLRKREDGWYRGTLQRTGKTGLFPASFVEPY